MVWRVAKKYSQQVHCSRVGLVEFGHDRHDKWARDPVSRPIVQVSTWKRNRYFWNELVTGKLTN